MSTETRTERHKPDSETTYDDYTQETQLLPGTHPNLAISPPNSPEKGSSHTETPSNSPPAAKFASGPLQRISEALSNFVTPKMAKLPQIPASTDSNPKPRTSTHFPATTRILPTKNPPPRNSNPQPPNLSQNLSQPQNQENKILHLPTTKLTKTTIKAPNLFGSDTQNQPQTLKPVSVCPTPCQATHATFSFPSTVETFFDNDTNNDSQHEPRHIPATSPDALTSSI
jgi:hypothetical protein